MSAVRILREAGRSLLGAPGTTALIVLVLSAGIAAATVTFAVVDTVVFRPLPFEAGQELAVVELREPRSPLPTRALAPAHFLELSDRLTSFVSLAAVVSERLTLDDGGGPERVGSARVTASLFDLLRVTPLVGHAFTAANEVEGQNGVALIGYDLWQRRFGGDRAIVGRTIQVLKTTIPGGKRTRIPVTIVGVMPPRFTYPIPENRLAEKQAAEIWLPYVMSAEERSGVARSRYLDVVGRLRPGVPLGKAQTQADTIAASPSVTTSEDGGQQTYRILRLKDRLVGPVRAWMVLTLIAVVIVVVIACVNVANLQLTRAAYRTRELSIRASLGATRGQLVASLLAESVMLSLGAAVSSLLLAAWGIRVARASLPAGVPRVQDLGLDVRVLAAALGAALVAGLFHAAVPAWQASREDLAALLKQPVSGGTAAGRLQWRASFAIVQVAFVNVLLVATALVVMSFIHVTTADLGFDRSDLLVVGTQGLREASLAAVLDRLQELPGVTSAGAVAFGSPPLIAAGFGGGASAAGVRAADAGPGSRPTMVEFRRVSSGYFATAGIAVLRGEVFDAGDRARDGDVAIDESTAAVLFGSRDPIGAELTSAMSLIGTRRVVAVVRNVRMSGPERSASPQIYLPLPLAAAGPDVLVRLRQPAATMVPAISAALAPWLPAGGRPLELRSVEEAFRNITADRRFNTTLMALFGALALLIGAAGVYGVMASIVAQRRRETGVRVALGATRRQVVLGVLGHSSRYLIAGVVIGVPFAAGVSRIFGSLLFQVQSTETLVYIGVAVMLLAAGLAATLIPALRASRVDPLVTLRAE